MGTPKIQDDFARHKASPEISTKEYVRARNIELGKWVMARECVYLDKCFWITLRDAHIGRTKDTAAHELLIGLTESVEQGRRVCPISDAIFLELMKQSDSETRLATAKLIDELSCGVTLVPNPTRIATEIAHFFHAAIGSKVYPLEVLIWSKLSYVLGVQHPVVDAFSTEDQAIIQKAFFDHMWNVSLQQILETLGESAPVFNASPDIAEHLNQGNAAHAHEVKSFAQVYKDEVYGCLELAAPIACDVLAEIEYKATGRPIARTRQERDISEKQVHNLLCAAIGKPSAKIALRTMHLGALFHAAVRWNRTQKLVSNDLYDFHHAEAALGYCNIFLTDGPMHTLLEQKHLNLKEHFPCRVISRLKEASSWAQ